MQTTLSPHQALLLRGIEVAAELGISRALAYRWMHDGTLPTVRQGRTVRVPRAALLAWIERKTQGTAA
jgi:excisionase family DNA binding protein